MKYGGVTHRPAVDDGGSPVKVIAKQNYELRANCIASKVIRQLPEASVRPFMQLLIVVWWVLGIGSADAQSVLPTVRETSAPHFVEGRPVKFRTDQIMHNSTPALAAFRSGGFAYAHPRMPAPRSGSYLVDTIEVNLIKRRNEITKFLYKPKSVKNGKGSIYRSYISVNSYDNIQIVYASTLFSDRPGVQTNEIRIAQFDHIGQFLSDKPIYAAQFGAGIGNISLISLKHDRVLVVFQAYRTVEKKKNADSDYTEFTVTDVSAAIIDSLGSTMWQGQISVDSDHSYDFERQYVTPDLVPRVTPSRSVAQLKNDDIIISWDHGILSEDRSPRFVQAEVRITVEEGLIWSVAIGKVSYFAIPYTASTHGAALVPDRRGGYFSVVANPFVTFYTDRLGKRSRLPTIYEVDGLALRDVLGMGRYAVTFEGQYINNATCSLDTISFIDGANIEKILFDNEKMKYKCKNIMGVELSNGDVAVILIIDRFNLVPYQVRDIYYVLLKQAR